LNDEGTPCLGLCYSDTKLILIEKDLPCDVFVEVLMHEYFHAVWFETGIDDNDPPSWLEHIFINATAKDMALNVDFFVDLFSRIE
jgi:hypothetical protein